MSSGEPRRRVRRILIALDDAHAGDRELELLAGLAADVEAELQGLFIEDADLLSLADLPFAREVSVRNGSARRMERARLERQLRGRAEEVRRMFEARARQLRLRHSFRVARGEVLGELLRAAETVDALIVGRHSWIGGTVRRLAASAPRTLIFLAPGRTTGRSVVVLHDGSEVAEAAVTLAAQMARAGHLDLTVLLAAEDEAKADELQEQAAARLGELSSTPRFRRIRGVDVPSLVDASHAEQARVLVLPADHPGLDPDIARDLISQAGCSLVLAR